MARVLTLNIQNDFEELARVARMAKDFLESHTLPSKVIYAARVVLEEILANIIKYGYSDQASHEINVRLEVKDAEVSVTCVDDGYEFNPLLATPPDIPKPVLKRDVGGLGLYLVRQMVDSMQYLRVGDKNVLEMRIKV